MTLEELEAALAKQAIEIAALRAHAVPSLADWKLPEDEDDWSPAWGRAMESGVPDITIPAGVLKFHSPVKITTRGVRITGAGSDRTVLQFVGTAGGVAFAPISDPDGDGHRAELHRCAVKALQPLPGADGIRIEARSARVVSVLVDRWTRDGVHVTGDVHRQPMSNANRGMLDNVTSTNNKRHGFYWQGGDSNIWMVTQCTAEVNDGDGFCDESFLGNYHLGVHCSANAGLAYRMEGNSQRGVLMGYAENGGLSIVSRGNLGINPRANYAAPGAVIEAAENEVRVTSMNAGRAGPRVRMGSPDPECAQEYVDMNASNERYTLVKRAAGGLQNLWAWTWKGASALVAFAMTTGAHARGAGLPVMPRGVLFGLGGGQRHFNVRATVPLATEGVDDDCALVTGAEVALYRKAAGEWTAVPWTAPAAPPPTDNPEQQP